MHSVTAYFIWWFVARMEWFKHGDCPAYRRAFARTGHCRSGSNIGEINARRNRAYDVLHSVKGA